MSKYIKSNSKVLQYKGDKNSAYKVAVKRLIQKGDLHYDEYGRIDGSVFSDEDQQKIKDEVERKYYNNKYSDK